MRILLLTCFALFLFNCNSSSKKDPGQAMDDTARMDNPPANTLTFTIEPVKILASDIPVSLKVKGEIQTAWKWTDKQGAEHYTTEIIANEMKMLGSKANASKQTNDDEIDVPF